MGALTNKPYAFQGRPWEIVNLNTIALTDPQLSLIQLSIRGKYVLRILPVVSEDLWITDTTRFFKSERITESSLIKKKNISTYRIANLHIQEKISSHSTVSIEQAFISIIEDICEKKAITFYLGSICDVTIISAIRSILNLQKYININLDFTVSRFRFDNDTSDLTAMNSFVFLIDTKNYPFLSLYTHDNENNFTLSKNQQELINLIEGLNDVEGAVIFLDNHLNYAYHNELIHLNQKQLNQNLILDRVPPSSQNTLNLFLQSPVEKTNTQANFLFSHRNHPIIFDVFILRNNNYQNAIYFNFWYQRMSGPAVMI